MRSRERQKELLKQQDRLLTDLGRLEWRNATAKFNCQKQLPNVIIDWTEVEKHYTP
jgi:hypothetical protein